MPTLIISGGTEENNE